MNEVVDPTSSTEEQKQEVNKIALAVADDMEEQAYDIALGKFRETVDAVKNATMLTQKETAIAALEEMYKFSSQHSRVTNELILKVAKLEKLLSHQSKFTD